MAQRWYFGGSTSGHGVLAPYAPATFKGSWDVEPDDPDRIFSPYKIGNSQTMARSETSATAPWRVCVTRGVSPALAAQTLDGDVDIVLGLNESSALADFFTRIYIYVTQGDSDLVRGVLLDYEETSAGGATEWPTTNTGTALQTPQTLSAVNALDGDRLVIEFGYLAENVSTTSRSGTVRVGARGTDLVANADLTVGSTSTITLAGFVEFQNTFTFSASEPTNMTPELATEMTPLAYTSGAVAVVSATYALWWKRTETGAENGYIGTFAGASAAGGNYIPVAQVREAVGATFPLVGSGYNADFQAYTIPIAPASIKYLEIYSSVLTNPPGRDLIVTAIGAPTIPADNADDYLISEDALPAHGIPTATLFNKSSGLITGMLSTIVLSENGVVADTGVFVFTDKQVGSGTENQPVIYDLDFSVIAAVVGATVTQAGGGQGNVPVATDGTNFYCAQVQSGLGPGILVSQFDQAGAITDQWTLPVPAGWTAVGSIAVARDGSVLYYATSAVNQPIKRWDLVNDLALADFLAANATDLYKDLYILRDDTLIFVQQVPATGGEVHRYDAAGVLLDTYAFADPFTTSTASWFIDHIAPGQDDPITFGIWFQQDNAIDSTWRDYVFERVTIATSAISDVLAQDTVLDAEDAILTPEPDAAASATYFGAPNSCPLIILGARGGTPPPPECPGDVDPLIPRIDGLPYTPFVPGG